MTTESSGENETFSLTVVKINGQPTGKKLNLEPYFTGNTRINFKWIRDLKVKKKKRNHASARFKMDELLYIPSILTNLNI